MKGEGLQRRLPPPFSVRCGQKQQSERRSRTFEGQGPSSPWLLRTECQLHLGHVQQPAVLRAEAEQNELQFMSTFSPGDCKTSAGSGVRKSVRQYCRFPGGREVSGASYPAIFPESSPGWPLHPGPEVDSREPVSPGPRPWSAASCHFAGVARGCAALPTDPEACEGQAFSRPSTPDSSAGAPSLHPTRVQERLVLCRRPGCLLTCLHSVGKTDDEQVTPCGGGTGRPCSAVVSTAGCPSRTGRDGDGPPGACIVETRWACGNLEEEHSGRSQQLPRCWVQAWPL